MAAKYVFKVTIEPAPDMGMDSRQAVQDILEEAIRDTGIDNAAAISVECIHEEE